MTQAAPLPSSGELPTANGAFRAARIAFVHSLWHREIVEEAYAGFIDEMAALGFPPGTVERFETPGAFEIPLHAQTLARTGKYAAVACSVPTSARPRPPSTIATPCSAARW
jgi:6,7-dimethyl-8-ribityllumazine synthase